MPERPCGCPDFEPADWEGQEQDLSHLAFYTRPVKYFFGSPVGFEKQAVQAADEIQKKGYALAEPLFVLEHIGRFSGELLVGILPPGEADPSLVYFSDSRFVAKVYRRKEASYQAGLRAFMHEAKSANRHYKAVFMWHVGCPRCVKQVGYTTVFLGELPAA